MSNEPKEFYVVISVARQIQGEYVFVVTEYLTNNLSKAQQKLNDLKMKYVDLNGQPKPQEITTPQGSAQCMCEAGIHIIELQE